MLDHLCREDAIERTVRLIVQVTPSEARRKMADMWLAMNNDPEMKELAAKSGFELVNIGPDQMDAFMRDKIKVYTDGAKMLGLGVKK